MNSHQSLTFLPARERAFFVGKGIKKNRLGLKKEIKHK